jgi:hypothetical protein
MSVVRFFSVAMLMTIMAVSHSALGKSKPVPSAIAWNDHQAVHKVSLTYLVPAPQITWQDVDYESRSQGKSLTASWSRTVMPTLADHQTPDGTRYLQLPLVRLYDSQGNRLKLREDITDPKVASDRLGEALGRMEVDEDAPTLANDMALLDTGFDPAKDLPKAKAYLIDYWAEWCKVNAPFQAALDNWQATMQAQGIVVIKAGADFGQGMAATR